MQKDPVSRDLVYQNLVILLHFCNTKIITLIPHLCTIMSTHDLILNVNIQHLSCHFVKFVITWLDYRKTHCNDILWNPRSLGRTPLDESFDKLKEYSILLNNKKMKDAYLNLQSAVSIICGHPKINYTFYKINILNN